MKCWLILLIWMEIFESINPFFPFLVRQSLCGNSLGGIGGFNRGNRFGGNGFGGNRFNGNRRIRRFPRGIREAILAYNAFCGNIGVTMLIFQWYLSFILKLDRICATDIQEQGVFLCIQRALDQGSQVIFLLRRCSGGADLQCGFQQRQRVNRCVIRASIGRRFRLATPRIQRCFRQTLSVATIDCLIRRNRILRVLLPLPPGPAGPVIEQPLPYVGGVRSEGRTQRKRSHLKKNIYKRNNNKIRLKLN